MFIRKLTPKTAGIWRLQKFLSLAFVSMFFLNIQTAHAAIVSVFEVQRPATVSFTGKVVIPVPKGLILDADLAAGVQKFGIIDEDGTTVPAQTDIITRYADAQTQGASVVQISANLHYSISNPNSSRQYQVVTFPHQDAVVRSPNWALRRVLGSLPNIPASVFDFIATPILKFETEDPFGNKYVAEPFYAPVANTRTFEFGDNVRTARGFGLMKPVNGYDPNPALKEVPAMFGIHMYASVNTTNPFIEISYLLFNGMSNKTSSPDDDIVGDKWMKYITLTVKQGWSFIPDVTNQSAIYTPEVNPDGSKTYYVLKPEFQGNLHELLHQQSVVRRGLLVPDGQEALGQSYLDKLSGRGMVAQGTNPEYFNWWNPLTPNYWMNGTRLYRHDEQVVSKSSIRSRYLTQFNKLKTAIISGDCTRDASGNCTGPVFVSASGIVHNFGEKGGGVTGGTGVWQMPFTDAINANSIEALKYALLMHRMVTSRMRDVLVNPDGSSFDLRQVLQNCPNSTTNKYQTAEFNPTTGQPTKGLLPNSNYNFHNIAGPTLGLVPIYDIPMRSHKIYDYQHRTRWLLDFALTIFGLGDPLAIEQAERHGHLIEATYTQYPVLKNGQCSSIGGSMRDALALVTSNPYHYAAKIGRDRGWQGVGMTLAYMLDNTGWRNNLYSWVSDYTKIVSLAQSDCTGHWYSNDNHEKIFAQYDGLQTYETYYVANALLGMYHHVLSNDPVKSAEVRSTLIDYYNALINPRYFHLSPNGSGYGYGQIATKNYNNPAYPIGHEFCPGDANFPSDGVRGNATYEAGSALANGFTFTGDATFLNRIHASLGYNIPNDPLREIQIDMEAPNTDKKYHWHDAISVFQEQYGGY